MLENSKTNNKQHVIVLLFLFELHLLLHMKIFPLRVVSAATVIRPCQLSYATSLGIQKHAISHHSNGS